MFERQWFGPHTQDGLSAAALSLEESLIKKDYHGAWDILLNSKQSLSSQYIHRQATRITNISVRNSGKPINVLFDGFWPDFTPEGSLIWRILSIASCVLSIELEVTNNPAMADICILSCFKRAYNESDIFHCTRVIYLGENVRPCYNIYDYSLSSDYFSYLGRNSYLPVWLLTLYHDTWKALLLSGNSASVSLDSLVEAYFERSPERSVNWRSRDLAVVYVGNNNEPVRMSVLSRLESLGVKVLRFGSLTNPIDNKQLLYSGFTHVLCPENSFYPGYITEKLIHSAYSGAVSIYWGGLSATWLELLGDRIIYLDPLSINDLHSKVLNVRRPRTALHRFSEQAQLDTSEILDNTINWTTRILEIYT